MRKFGAVIAIAVTAAGLLWSSPGVGLDTCVAAEEKDRSGKKKMTTIYDYKAKSLEGKEIDFDKYKDQVVLIVNTASECGYTPQYKGLEDLHKKYSPRGLTVLGFPCNQFGAQEPGDNHQIANFCEKNYGVDFQLFEKVDVNGPAAHPIYKHLIAESPEGKGEAIKWNFTKFLINKKGEVVHRFDSKVKPEELGPEIEKLL